MAAGSLGSLVVSLTAETAQFTAALDKASYNSQKNFKSISSFAKTAAGSLAALYGASSLAGFVKSQIDLADATVKMSQKVGVSVEELSKLQYAAKLADVDAAGLQTGLVKLSKGMVEAANGTGQARNAFAAMGIAIKNADGSLKGNSQVLAEVADRFVTYGDGVNKTNLAVQIFGKSGAELIPLLNGGSDAIRQAGDELERFGAVITEKAAKNAEQFNDNLTRLSTVGSALGKSIANDIMPYLNQLAEEFLVARANGLGFMDMLQMGLRFGDYKDQIASINKEIANLRQMDTEVLPQDQIDRDIAGLEKQKTALEELVKVRDKTLNPPATPTNTKDAPFSADLEKAKAEADKYAKGLSSAEEANKKFINSISDMSDKAEADIAAMFMTDAQKKQQQDLDAVNKGFLSTQQAITKQYTEGKLGLTAYNEQMTVLGSQYELATNQANMIYEKQEQLNSSYGYGASVSLSKYVNESRNLANVSNGAVNNALRGVEDGLFNVITGAQGASQAFKSMVTSILSDIAKLLIRQSIVAPLVNAIAGGIGGFTSTSSTPMASAAASNNMLTPFAVGTNYIPYDNYPALLHKGEAVVPAAYNPAAGGISGSQNAGNVIVNVNMQSGSVESQDGNKLGLLIGNVVKSELVKQKRAGGILA
jgi:lambda family phage tail tape measure protein